MVIKRPFIGLFMGFLRAFFGLFMTKILVPLFFWKMGQKIKILYLQGFSCPTFFLKSGTNLRCRCLIWTISICFTNKNYAFYTMVIKRPFLKFRGSLGFFLVFSWLSSWGGLHAKNRVLGVKKHEKQVKIAILSHFLKKKWDKKIL